jgi:hypothetical protein
MGNCLRSNKPLKDLSNLNSNNNFSKSINGTSNVDEQISNSESDPNKLTKEEKQKLASEFRPKKDSVNIYDLLYANSLKSPKMSSRNSMNVGRLYINRNAFYLRSAMI